MKILCVAESIGKTHDFKLYKDSVGHRMLNTIKAQADSGYQGITMYHLNSETPKKKPRGGRLTAEEKAENKRISRERIYLNTSMRKSKSLKFTIHNLSVCRPYANIEKGRYKASGNICKFSDNSLSCG